MNQDQDRKLWSDVDAHLEELLIPEHESLDFVTDANAAAGLPAIDVSATQGKLLYLLAILRGAKNVLELGTLGGFSTIWMARALPAGGKLTTIEYDAHHADVARKNIERAGFANVVEVHVGAALDVLPRIEEQGLGPFDFTFIDADKQNYPSYLDWAIKLSRPGSVIVGDNAIRRGAILDSSSDDPNVIGAREFLNKLNAEPRLETTGIQTVGVKGYDGFTLSIVR